MWFANFFIAGSITMVLPFISLYIEEFGNFSGSYVQNWSGWIFAITFVTAFIFSPVWGRIGDKYGRKNILILSSMGLGLSVFLMGFADSVWELFLLRLFMGIFTGFIPMSQALISTQTPKEIAGRVLGTLQTGSITGSLMGPLLGGALADSFGYASTFKWISITIFLSGFIVLFGVREILIKSTESAEGQQSYTSKEVLLHIAGNPVLLVVMLISTLVQIAHFSIQPILSLYVAEIHGPASIAFFSGMAFSAAGLGNLLMTRRWGRLGDRIGYIKILIFLLFMAGIVYFPGAFVTNIWQLVILRFLLGISIGGIIPVRIAYIRQEAPLSMQGEVLGYNTSLRFLGNIIGPALGGMLAGLFGFSAVFFVTSSLLIISGVIMLAAWYKHEYAGKRRKQTHPLSS
ncbi:Predicted arabinose efflux permease, MFS family [Lentibacillus halodurans]|uniref:Predicted arabinose efflux permease, MFS family n=1 Tax=Lentibacillus halodurans TaxID=237679 RepID=A0A1I0X734_9BACI|nr:MFS transporter [Lentibacillus halodurans]SFA96815.1 Predicted arabinose efflux permease, MFS family [Lentibacillus halodurans]